MSILAGLVKFVAGICASAGSAACLVVFFDEPECPKNLIK